jgi:hypothetical protein
MLKSSLAIITLRFALAALWLGLAGCSGGFELPEPPNMSRLAIQYAEPTAQLGPQTAATFIEEYLLEQERLKKVDNLKEATKTLGEFVSSTSKGEDDSVEINGVPVKTDAVVTVVGDCSGWTDQGAAKDAISMQLVVRRSKIVPIAWGELLDCRSETKRGGETVRVHFSGDISVYMAGLSASDDATSYLVSYEFDTAMYGDELLNAWTGSFRLDGETIEILIENDSGETVVGYGGPNPAQIGVRAANGNWHCTPGERRCESVEQSGSSFSY